MGVKRGKGGVEIDFLRPRHFCIVLPPPPLPPFSCIFLSFIHYSCVVFPVITPYSCIVLPPLLPTLAFLSPKIVTFSDTILITIYSPPIAAKSCIELPLLPPKMMLNFDGNWLRIPPTTPNLHLFWCKNSTRRLYSLLLVGPRHFIQPTYSLFSSDNLAVLRLPRIFNIQLLSKTT